MNRVNLVVFFGATAKRNSRDAVIAVNILTSTPMINTRAKPVTTDVLPK